MLVIDPNNQDDAAKLRLLLQAVENDFPLRADLASPADVLIEELKTVSDLQDWRRIVASVLSQESLFDKIDFSILESIITLTKLYDDDMLDSIEMVFAQDSNNPDRRLFAYGVLSVGGRAPTFYTLRDDVALKCNYPLRWYDMLSGSLPDRDQRRYLLLEMVHDGYLTDKSLAARLQNVRLLGGSEIGKLAEAIVEAAPKGARDSFRALFNDAFGDPSLNEGRFHQVLRKPANLVSKSSISAWQKNMLSVSADIEKVLSNILDPKISIKGSSDFVGGTVVTQQAALNELSSQAIVSPDDDYRYKNRNQPRKSKNLEGNWLQ